jgi:hypothetical protein
VKPLVWQRGIVDWAKPLPGMKYFACSTTPEGYWAWWLDGTDVRSVEPDEEAAKAAAQADYEARILSALDNNNTGKEVRPDEPRTPGPTSDIGPGDQAVAGAAGPFRASPSDWTEDFAHENGAYMCRCFTCGEQFFGYKRRVTCRVCAKLEPVAGAAQKGDSHE